MLQRSSCIGACFLEGRWSKKKKQKKVQDGFLLICGEPSDGLRLRISVIVWERQPCKDLGTELHLKRKHVGVANCGAVVMKGGARWWSGDYPPHNSNGIESSPLCCVHMSMEQ